MQQSRHQSVGVILGDAAARLVQFDTEVFESLHIVVVNCHVCVQDGLHNALLDHCIIRS